MMYKSLQNLFKVDEPRLEKPYFSFVTRSLLIFDNKAVSLQPKSFGNTYKLKFTIIFYPQPAFLSKKLGFLNALKYRPSF